MRPPKRSGLAWVLRAGLLFGFAWGVGAWAQTAPELAPPPPPLTKAAPDRDGIEHAATEEDPVPLTSFARKSAPAFGSLTVKGGEPTDPRRFPALYSFGKGELCTGSLVAAQTLITAAHCIRNLGRITLPVRPWTKTETKGTCHHPEYDETAPNLDMALCYLDAPVQGPYERLNRDPGRIDPAKRPTVILMGFGCDGDTPDKQVTFRTGSTTVIGMDNAAYVARGQASVCLGDSGGPAFLIGEDGARLEVAVNTEERPGGDSWLASTSSAAALTFIKTWAGKQKVKQRICGIDDFAPNCL